MAVSFVSVCLAHEAGHFAEELAPVEVKGKKGPEQFSADEHPRPESTLEKMASLKAVFKKGGTVTAANASVSVTIARVQWSLYNPAPFVLRKFCWIREGAGLGRVLD